MSKYIKQVCEEILLKEDYDTPEPFLNFSKNQQQEENKKRRVIFKDGFLEWNELTKEKKINKIKNYMRLNCIDTKNFSKYKFKYIKYDKNNKTIKSMTVVLKD